MASKFQSLILWRIGLAVVLFALSWYWAFSESMVKALWPSIVALGLVVLLRRVLLALVLGGLAGCIILTNGNPIDALAYLLNDLFIPIWSSSWKLGALAFTLILGGMAALIERSGGLHAILAWFMKKKNGHPSDKIQWSAFGIGLICFFDGLANSMLVGRLMKNLAERSGLSRVKLAYIVDSTSSAVSCVAVVSTWIAYQLAMIREGYDQVGQPVDAYRLFVLSIPYNFYCWFTLLLLVFSIWKVFNPGLMRRYEREARKSVGANHDFAIEQGSGRPWFAIVPLMLLILSLLIGLYVSGSEKIFPITFKGLSEAFGQADAASVLVVSSIIASVTAFLLFPRTIGSTERLRTFAQGSSALLVPVMVLIGAWILGGVMKPLGTAEVISKLLSGDLPVWLIPLTVFLAGAAISFSTGTSWGTMGILMPLAIPVVFELTAGMPGAMMPAVVAAVFSGAVFGDHCSPISDTTLVSSISTGVEATDHVATQMPFALIAATAAIVIGFVPVGLGLSPWASLVVGVCVLGLIAHWGRER
ncbi:Na+/H+ antiporter NhaC family protein [Rubellicoccus peritrichatus]|uniref:Na+/H+ antiporter NhaC family protein n=1 Tax=Rubellicoccus peritrichatus TaxID=3080537 RepID=A0AAQ3LCG8_9BACT|nr:Na+/H+ antiporter NhaC family protein [Puniceicoccus sp. CR14]WOO41902.1 Na+/H+ antiporter NhaC family protein [Puniceicoccus sp. CR14]